MLHQAPCQPVPAIIWVNNHPFDIADSVGMFSRGYHQFSFRCGLTCNLCEEGSTEPKYSCISWRRLRVGEVLKLSSSSIVAISAPVARRISSDSAGKSSIIRLVLARCRHLFPW